MKMLQRSQTGVWDTVSKGLKENYLLLSRATNRYLGNLRKTEYS